MTGKGCRLLIYNFFKRKKRRFCSIELLQPKRSVASEDPSGLYSWQQNIKRKIRRFRNLADSSKSCPSVVKRERDVSLINPLTNTTNTTISVFSTNSPILPYICAVIGWRPAPLKGKSGANPALSP